MGLRATKNGVVRVRETNMSQGHVIIPLGAVNPLASGCAQATNASKVGGLRSKNTEVPKAPDPTSAVLRESETH